MFLTWLFEWIGLCWLVQDRHHPTKNTKATKGNMIIVLTLFGFDNSIPLKHITFYRYNKTF